MARRPTPKPDPTPPKKTPAKKRRATPKAKPAAPPPAPAETDEPPAADDRAMRAADLMRAGATVEQIAGMADMGFSSTDEVMDALRQGIAETYRVERELLDSLQKALLPVAMEGQWLAVDRLLQISDRRARLLGLDDLARPAPEKPKDGLDDLAAQRARRRAGSAGATGPARP